jgi:fructose-1-phosphate kinase PfkB-like protein
MYSKTDPNKVNPEEHELQALADKKVPASTIKAAQEKVHDEVAKWRPRYHDYLVKREIITE